MLLGECCGVYGTVSFKYRIDKIISDESGVKTDILKRNDDSTSKQILLLTVSQIKERFNQIIPNDTQQILDLKQSSKLERFLKGSSYFFIQQKFS